MRSIDSMIVDGVSLKRELKEKIRVKLNLLRNERLAEVAMKLLKDHKILQVNIRASLSRHEKDETVVEYVEEMIEDYLEFSESVDMLFKMRKDKQLRK
jgi:DNA gyrase/topoisomerase IV subunit A